jgi:predicted ABC-type ATPase
MIAGPNGSGKSTLTHELQRLGINLGIYLNADDIAATMKGDPTDIAIAAQQIVRERRAEALKLKQDHCFETVMSHTSHIDHLIAARAAGFETRLFFVATEDPLINTGRVANRVQHGGHTVPSQKIIERYSRSLANLAAAVAACDSGIIYDNSSISTPLRPFIRISRGIQFACEVISSHFDDESQTWVYDYYFPRWWNKLMSPQGRFTIAVSRRNGRIFPI